MNFNCIIKTGLVAVAAMVSLSSFSQDLIARQAPCRTIGISRPKSLSKLEQPVCTRLRKRYYP